MHFTSRAGFLALLVFSLTLLHVFAAPVSVPPTTSIMRRDNEDAAQLGDYPHSRYQVAPSPHSHLRHHKHHHKTLTSEDPHRPILLPRKSIFTKIKEGFKKAGQAIKKGFQKVGGAIKTAAKAVGNVAKKVGNGIKTAAKAVGNGIKTAAKKVGNGIKTVAKKVGNGIKTVAKKVGNGIKTVAKKVGNGIKTAAKKVGHFVKTTGAKIAKFGLKVMATAASVASKVAKFIPGIGKPISQALKAESKVEDLASNAIHANLGKKLEKGMNIMNKIEHPVSGAAGAIIDNLKRDVDRRLVFQRELF